MVINLDLGKLVLTPTELVCKLKNGVTLRAWADDIRLYCSPPLLVADAGAVGWTLPLASAAQLDAIREFYGFSKE